MILAQSCPFARQSASEHPQPTDLCQILEASSTGYRGFLVSILWYIETRHIPSSLSYNLLKVIVLRDKNFARTRFRSMMSYFYGSDAVSAYAKWPTLSSEPLISGFFLLPLSIKPEPLHSMLSSLRWNFEVLICQLVQPYACDHSSPIQIPEPLAGCRMLTRSDQPLTPSPVTAV